MRILCRVLTAEVSVSQTMFYSGSGKLTHEGKTDAGHSNPYHRHCRGNGQAVIREMTRLVFRALKSGYSRLDHQIVLIVAVED